MDILVSLKKILKKGALDSELEFHRASVIDRSLRLLIKKRPGLAEDRKRLRDILQAYENRNWVNAAVTDQQVEESDLAEKIAERERLFYQKRKGLIKARLKEKRLTQKQLGAILGHSSETYISELINGINAFTVNDLILIHKILGIELGELIPATLSTRVISRTLDAISSLNHPDLKLNLEDLIEV